LTVGNSLFGKIIVEDHSVLAVVSEVLTHGTAGVWGKKLEWGRVRSSGSDNDSVSHGISLLESTDQLSNGGSLLADTNVDAHQLVISRLGLLVDDGVDGNSGLTSLTITNDQLTLSSSDGDESVNGFQTGGHWLMDGLAGNDTGGFHFSTRSELGIDWAFAIDGFTESINNSAKELWADRNIDDGAGALDGVTLQDGTIITEDDNTNVGVLKIESHSSKTRGEDNHLTSLNFVESIDAGNTISNRDNFADFIKAGG
jgi:hypothetical protein